ncbi:G5 domain-containing protein [Streptococcus suis]|uniref:G5 domain-containing protein n=6 Tax=Streptococcus suis TaxID=1307 RepID=UPI00209B4466|nr:G5 domain-containing protein [Streptococcus suis]MCO8192811.1 G5 domain-containing protein [Streptococcus suis]HEM3515078.1 G5 domain-containing protein [Streptococcus suis]
MRSKRFQGLVGLALIASLLNPLPWFNNVMLIGSTVVNANDLPPGETPPGEDEELPDAEQLALIKKISGYLSEIEASLADGDKDTADYLFTESDAVGGYATSIAAVSNVKNSAERAKLQARIEAIRAQLSGTVQPPSPVITTEEVTETKEEPYETIRIKDPNLEEGKEEVATPGQAGVRTIVYTVTKTDGVETGRVVKSDSVTTPAVNEVIKVGTKKTVVSVITLEEETETKAVPYETIRENDPTLEEGKEVVSVAGKAGVRTIVYTVTKTDGVETSRVVKSDSITTPAVNEVIKVGTKKAPVITTEEVTETKAVSYETVRENDPTLDEGKEVVSVAGKAGVRTIVYTVTKTDGVETSRVVKSDSVTTPAVNEVIKVGTKKAPVITTEEVTETKAVPYETVRENDPTLEEGKEVVSVAGKAGVRTIVYTVTKTDGVETSRVVKSDSVTTPAVNEVIKVGTKKVPGITTEEVTGTKAVPYETVRENDPTLEEGKEVISVAGKAGVRTIVYTVTKTDGVETSRVVKSDSVTTPAVNEVIKVGTKKVPVITTEEVTETKAVPYETVRENDPTLEEGKEVVSVAGKAGVRTIVYTVTKTDGVETSRVVKSDSVTTPAVNEVIKVGTKKVPGITTEEVTETKAVPYETVRENDPTLEEGKEVVSVAGKAGVRTIVYTVTKTDGVETSRVVKSDSVTTPAVNEVIKVGTKKVPGITTEEVTETEAIPYETVRENDPTLEEGKEVVSVAGKAGVRTIVYTVTKTDGVETGREVKSDVVTTPAVNEVIKVGTKKAPVITTEEVTETEAVAYETVREDDPTLEEGKEVVSVAGKAGVRTIVYTVTKTDGVETSREVKSDTITTPAVNEVIKVGTKKAPVITTEEVIETEAVAYETVREDDPTLEEGKEVVSVAGKAGVRTIVYTVTKTDGVETGREVKSDVVTTPAVNEVIKVGTKKAPVITTEEVIETEAVAYETVREDDPTLEEGKEVVSVAGKAGVRTIVYTVTKTDGVETGREVKSDTITTPAVNEVIKVGTKKAPVITTEEVTETEAVAYETVRENDPTLEEGKEVVSVAGKAGVRTIVYTVTKTDGVETGREVKSDVVTTPAVNEVIKVGTKKVAPSIKNDVQKNEETVTKPQTSQNDKNKTVLPETGERVSTSIWMTFVGFVMMGVAFIKKRKQQ